MTFFSRPRSPDPAESRRAMVDRQLRPRGIDDERVLSAMEEVPRHQFVPGDRVGQAYADRALPIGEDQTISQPYIVARMTELLEPAPGLRVLEVGTGSGYQAAVLAACGMEVYTVERIPRLSRRAREALERTGHASRVHMRVGDGSRGWEEHAPYDRVMVTAAAGELPARLREQVIDGGIIVAPVGGRATQWLRRYRREGDEWTEEEFEAARFVPLVTNGPGENEGPFD